MARRLLLALALLRTAQATGTARGVTQARGPGSQDMKLFLLQDEQTHTRGVCLDGTAPAYYFRPGWGSGECKWLVYYEGGGWCAGDEDCFGRSSTDLGSSKRYTATLDMAVRVGGYFSNDSAVNPMFYNWNVVYLKYCDGTSYSGYRPEPVYVNGTAIWYRGRLVNEAFISSVVYDRNMIQATDVVIAGCSAGGMAVYLHVDRWADAMAHTRAKVRGLSDSGFFPNLNLNDCQLGTLLRRSAEGSCIEEGVNQGCIKAYSPDKAYHCFNAQYTLPFIRTPVFSMMSKYDTIYARLGSCIPLENTTQTTDLGGIFQTLFIASHLSSNVPHGWLVDACPRHCYSGGPNVAEYKDYWNLARGPSGRSARQMFEGWYEGKGRVWDWREEAAVEYPYDGCP